MKIRSILRSTFHHPFLLSTIFSLVLIYEYLPSLFNLLLGFSPTILFTTILLAIVLAYGEPNIPENWNAENQFNRTRALVVEWVREHDPLGESESSISVDSDLESEIIPTLDEIHPLLESELAQSGLESKDVSESEPEFTSDNASVGEETEKEDEAEKVRKVVAWTADDQKNLMSVGSSEIERNTRLEHLTARQKAVRKLLERDLIDLEGMDSSQLQIQPVIAPRMNPFDLPYEEEVPGSAPSVLLPTTRNPFDITFEQPEENGPTLARDSANISSYAYNNNNHAGARTSTNSITGFANQDFRRNGMYRRHESFTIGAPVVFMEDVRPEPRASRFKPFFIPEGLDGTESDTEREASERSDVHDESSAERESRTAHDVLSESSSSDKSERGGKTKEIEEESTYEELNESSANKHSYVSSVTKKSSQIVVGDDERTMGSASSTSDVDSDHETVSNAVHLGEH
jgi:hypothetical protein